MQADGAGFPDLILVRRGRVVACELKADRGQLTDQQHDWLRALAAADATLAGAARLRRLRRAAAGRSAGAALA